MKKPLPKSVTDDKDFSAKLNQIDAYIKSGLQDYKKILMKARLYTEAKKEASGFEDFINTIASLYGAYRLNSSSSEEAGNSLYNEAKNILWAMEINQTKGERLLQETEKVVDGAIEKVLGRNGSRDAGNDSISFSS